MNDKKNRRVIVQALVEGKLVEDARLKGYHLRRPEDPLPTQDGMSVISEAFWGLVSDDLYAQIAASSNGVLIPIELPCVFLAEIRTRAEAQQLSEGEVICEAWDIGATMGRRHYIGYALYSSYEAAQRHNHSADMDVGQNPAGISFGFGGIWRARVDEATMAKLRALNGGPLFSQRGGNHAEPIVPFDNWYGGDREPT